MTSLAEVEERWESILSLVANTEASINRDMESKQFRDELTTLKKLASSYELWVTHAANVSDEALEISRQLEQCRVRLYIPQILRYG